ncbi:MAG: 16S rRNA (cytidine(1402)-2'-O)-methyltransferase [Coriobacteriia bacterium]|nr:16S rRNA (cytidine(1402)-2'-O)-methyltransferase [Coriobacteriia bacterium]
MGQKEPTLLSHFSIVSTPIGNLGDISARASETLRNADTVLAEDTRVTRKLLTHLDAKADLERFDEHTAFSKTPIIVERVRGGESIALVSDAGTPTISDPGQILIDALLDAELPVTVIPGPSAITAALALSGLSADTFYFGGFLPRKVKARRDLLEALAPLETTLVFYESPKRLVKTLQACAEVLGDRRGAVTREMTKLHEEVVRAELPDLAARFEARDSIKGEIVLVIAPPRIERAPRVHVDKYGG